MAPDVLRATNLSMHMTTKFGKPRRRMNWKDEMNSFIIRAYYTVTNLETYLTTYRYTFHRAFIEKFSDI